MVAEELPRPFGPYTLLDTLGRGGMGQVYLATRAGLGEVQQLSVIKTLRTSRASDSEYISRFEDEAKTVVQLSHRNIARVFDIGIIDGTYYMAMELVSGVDLDTLAARALKNGGLPPPQAVTIIAEVLEALDYAHRFKDPMTGEPLRIVHRDVSPHNVMVSYEGEVKLIDFGLSASRLKKTETAPQVVMGKLLYMAPEQARDDAVDGRSDLYAVGIMLAELLTGRRYYEGMTAHEVWERVGIGFSSELLNALPAGFRTVCARATAADPTKRYPTADAFRAELLVAAREQGWFLDSSELRRILSGWLAFEEESFRHRLRHAVKRSGEVKQAQSETVVVSNPTTQITTLASALGSALQSSTSSGEQAESTSGVYAASRSMPRSASANTGAPRGEPYTAVVDVNAIASRTQLSPLSPDEATEQDGGVVSSELPVPARGPARTASPALADHGSLEVADRGPAPAVEMTPLNANGAAPPMSAAHSARMSPPLALTTGAMAAPAASSAAGRGDDGPTRIVHWPDETEHAEAPEAIRRAPPAPARRSRLPAVLAGFVVALTGVAAAVWLLVVAPPPVSGAAGTASSVGNQGDTPSSGDATVVGSGVPTDPPPDDGVAGQGAGEPEKAAARVAQEGADAGAASGEGEPEEPTAAVDETVSPSAHKAVEAAPPKRGRAGRADKPSSTAEQKGRRRARRTQRPRKQDLPPPPPKTDVFGRIDYLLEHCRAFKCARTIEGTVKSGGLKGRDHEELAAFGRSVHRCVQRCAGS